MAQAQPDFRALARREFPGFSVTGTGPFAVLSTSSTLIAELFEYELLAKTRAAEIGSKVLRIRLPEPKAQFRRIREYELISKKKFGTRPPQSLRKHVELWWREPKTSAPQNAWSSTPVEIATSSILATSARHSTNRL